MRRRFLAIVLAAGGMFATGLFVGQAAPIGAGGRKGTTGQTTQPTTATTGPTTTGGGSCTVEITGPKKVCLHCNKKGELKPPKDQPLVVLTAKGMPAGGTYTWSVAETGEGKITHAQGTNPGAGAGPDKLFVHGKAPSKPRDDVAVTVLYKVTVSGSEATCNATHKLTVIKPTSLRVVDEMQFLVRNGEVQGSVPDKYRAAVDRVMEDLQGNPEKKHYAGVILIRFYEVLDQFGDLLECSGKDGLTEQIFPKEVKQGGTDVTNGVPAQPDRVYQIESEKKKPFKGKEYVQAIQIFGCPVRYNKFVFTRDGVTATELTQQQYNEELERLKKTKAC